MTYGYGEDMSPRRRDQHWDQSDESAAADPSVHSGTWSHRPPYQPQRPPHASDGQYGGHPYAPGHGTHAPQGYQAQPPAGSRTPHQDTGLRHDAAQQAAYRAGEYGDPRQYGNPGSYGAGPVHGREPRGADRSGQPERRSHKLLIFTIVLVVLAISGAGGWYYLNRKPKDPVASVNPPSTEQAARVADQKIDPIPLTVTEVFSSETITSSNGQRSYKILKTQAADDCKTAVAGDIAAVLTASGCSQVVRATLMSPDGTLVITAGILNLADQAKARKAPAAIKAAIDSQKGRFSGLLAGGSTNTIDRAAANVGWDVRGHYLMYCVIANADGSAIAENDSRTQPIINDVVETYLGGDVIHRREAGDDPSEAPSTLPS